MLGSSVFKFMRFADLTVSKIFLIWYVDYLDMHQGAMTNDDVIHSIT